MIDSEMVETLAQLPKRFLSQQIAEARQRLISVQDNLEAWVAAYMRKEAIEAEQEEGVDAVVGEGE